jgi:hypothetical protein
MTDYVTHRYNPNPELCEHKTIDFEYKWRERTHFIERNGQTCLSIPCECVDCGAEGRQTYKPDEIEWEE